jgi:Zn finger protein HypA/HybF involved in hydrogenase expression
MSVIYYECSLSARLIARKKDYSWKNMRCLTCKESLLSNDVEVCPYCDSRNVVSDEKYAAYAIEEMKKLEKAGRYEDAAKGYEELDMLDKAGDCRRLARTNYVVSASLNIGKIAAISLECPHCGASQPVTSKSNEIKCNYCNKNYIIPKKVLELL